MNTPVFPLETEGRRVGSTMQKIRSSFSPFLYMIDAPAPVSVRLDGPRDYDVYFDSLRDLPDRMSEAELRTGRCIVVTDENVGAHYRSPVRTTLERAGWTPRVITIPAGEASKSPDRLQAIYDEALDWGIDRETPVVALGGGVVGDLGGYAAATLLRGVPLVQCPTSLIAQVDSALGGKTGINHDAGKNLIGAFYQPRFVLADLDTIDTLPQREWTSGMAEVIKHALIADPSLFDTLEARLVDVMTRADRNLQARVTRTAAAGKADVVSDDERESGRRAILNFGHTVAHAVETVAGYGRFTHGEAVALGMRANLYLSNLRHDTVPLDRADHVVNAVPQQHDPTDLPFDALYEAMRSDKKNRGAEIRFVLLDRIGHAYLTGEVTREEVRQAWTFACSGMG